MDYSKYYIQEFKKYISLYTSSPNTVKNYLSDLRLFLSYVNLQGHEVNPQTLAHFLAEPQLSQYEAHLSQINPPATTKRRLSSLKKFVEYCATQGLIINTPPAPPPPLNSQPEVTAPPPLSYYLHTSPDQIPVNPSPAMPFQQPTPILPTPQTPTPVMTPVLIPEVAPTFIPESKPIPPLADPGTISPPPATFDPPLHPQDPFLPEVHNSAPSHAALYQPVVVSTEPLTSPVVTPEPIANRNPYLEPIIATPEDLAPSTSIRPPQPTPSTPPRPISTHLDSPLVSQKTNTSASSSFLHATTGLIDSDSRESRMVHMLPDFEKDEPTTLPRRTQLNTSRFDSPLWTTVLYAASFVIAFLITVLITIFLANR